ncbi:MAG: hypothetical protein QXJ75_05635 [Candidatus Bathyarchaeia archaeon]
MLTVPIPATFEDTVWLAFGFTFARAFGKRFDQDVQNSEWFKCLKNWQRWLVQRLLDFTHHWQWGALLMLYAPWTTVYWFGVGVFLDDIPDIPRRVKNYFTPTVLNSQRHVGGSAVESRGP